MNGIDYKGINPTNWWISEKYDGIRGYWNGNNFYSKQGELIICPEEFKNKMPINKLDGELWIGYNQFTGINSILKSNNWNEINFQIFDICDEEYKNLIFEERLEKLKELKSQIKDERINVNFYFENILNFIFYFRLSHILNVKIKNI